MEVRAARLTRRFFRLTPGDSSFFSPDDVIHADMSISRSGSPDILIFLIRDSWSLRDISRDHRHENGLSRSPSSLVKIACLRGFSLNPCTNERVHPYSFTRQGISLANQLRFEESTITLERQPLSGRQIQSMDQRRRMRQSISVSIKRFTKSSLYE